MDLFLSGGCGDQAAWMRRLQRAKGLPQAIERQVGAGDVALGREGLHGYHAVALRASGLFRHATSFWLA
jgi:hypothetical protein